MHLRSIVPWFRLHEQQKRRAAISLLNPYPFGVVEEDDDAYVKGFHSLDNLDACRDAVPTGTTVVVLDGVRNQNATIFAHGVNTVSAVRNGGDYRIANIEANTGVQIGDNNVVTYDF